MKLVLFFVGLVALSSAAVLPGQKQGDKGALCDKCKQLVDSYITEDSVQKILEEGVAVCAKLPSNLADACKTFFAQYASQAAAEIIANRDQLCVFAHLCPGPQMVQAQFVNGAASLFLEMIQATHKDAASDAAKDQLGCDACKMALNVAKSILSDPLFKDDFRKALVALLCGDPPSSQDCADTVNGIYRAIMAIFTNQAYSFCPLTCGKIKHTGLDTDWTCKCT